MTDSAVQPLVGVIMGSRSDLRIMQSCLDMLDELGVPFEASVVSAPSGSEKVRNTSMVSVPAKCSWNQRLSRRTSESSVNRSTKSASMRSCVSP